MDFSLESVNSRLRRSFFAGGLGFAINILNQILSVPILLYYWGANLYGEWLILMAIPSYLSFSNLGISDACATQITLLSGKKKFSEAAEVYDNSLKVVSIVFLLFASVIFTFASVQPSFVRNIGVVTSAINDIPLILGLIILYLFLGLQCSLLNGPFRSVGRNAEHIFIVNVGKFFELFFGLGLVAFGDFGILGLITVHCMVRTAVFIILLIWKRRINAWAKISASSVNFSPLRQVLSPSLSTACYTLGNLVVNQGVVILIGSLAGGPAVATFTVVRTVARLPIKFAGIFNNAFLPELSLAFSRGEVQRFQSLFRNLFRLSGWFLCVLLVILSTCGVPLIEIWTFGRIKADQLLLILMLIEAFCFFFSYTGSVVLVSINRHQRFVIVYLVISVLAIIGSYFSIGTTGVWIIPAVFAGGYSVIATFNLYESFRYTKDRFSSFFTFFLGIM